ncbi:MAG: CPBP family glutamic-type intramembrane protease [Betaproteobacteria bacterium]|nr:CPBP family glutamic-type intramembrane protease [Betaproteobacteria bacterium]
MSRRWARGLALCAALTACAARAEPSPGIASLASLIVPGLGQASNGDYAEAAAHFGIYAVSTYSAIRASRRPDFIPENQRYQFNFEYVNRTTLIFDYAARLSTDTALYSSYGAYRDARRNSDRLYRTPAPSESLTDLALAPFSLEFLSRPTTYVPLAFQLWGVMHAQGGYGIYRGHDVSQRDLHLFNATANEMTAVGEEAFFRGVLNNSFSNSYGNRWGLGISSTLFGLAHSGQGQTASIAQAALAGAYLGWVQQRNDFAIGQGVAIHYWMNLLAGISAIRNGGSTPLFTLRLAF